MPQRESYHPEQPQKIKGKKLQDIEKELYEDIAKKLEEEEIPKILGKEKKVQDNLAEAEKEKKES